MERATLMLPLFLLIIALLVLLAVIYTRGHWQRKAALILLVPSLTLVVWGAIGTYRGWPAADELPEKFQLIAADVMEPGTPNAGVYGAIFLWVWEPQSSRVVTVLGYRAEIREPRAYRVPYTRTLHERIEKAKKMLCEGRPVFGGRTTPGSDSAHANGIPENGGSEGGDEEIQLYELPPSEPVPKNLQ